MSEESFLPKPKKRGWLMIYVGIGALAVTGLILSLLYRDVKKPTDVLQKERHKNAKAVSYAVIFSSLEGPIVDTIVDRIITDIGIDTLTTDMVLGSTVTDPWCASVGEYERMIRKSLAETNELGIGKQTMIMSMIAGLLTKSDLPARIYLIGTLNGPMNDGIISRTKQTAAAFALREHAMGKVTVISLLRPAADSTNAAYAKIFSGFSHSGF